MQRDDHGNWKRPYRKVDERPPGLKGKQIGLYYKNRQVKKDENMIHFEVPNIVLAALEADLKSIEVIAQNENIYIPPAKQLKFYKPSSSIFNDRLNFIPLTPTESEKQSHFVTNIIPRDDDVICVNNEPQFAKCEPLQSVYWKDDMFLSDDPREAKKYQSKPKATRFNAKVLLLDDPDSDFSNDDKQASASLPFIITKAVEKEDNFFYDKDKRATAILSSISSKAVQMEVVTLEDDKSDVIVQNESLTSNDTSVIKATVHDDKRSSALLSSITSKAVKMEVTSGDVKVQNESLTSNSTSAIKATVHDDKRASALLSSITSRAVKQEVVKSEDVKVQNESMTSTNTTSTIKATVHEDKRASALLSSITSKAVQIEDFETKGGRSVNIINKEPMSDDSGADEAAVMEDKRASALLSSIASSAFKPTILKQEDVKPVKFEEDESDDDSQLAYSVTNRYVPRTSEEHHGPNSEYKYGYDDIITGSFQEKLDESIAKGISINLKNNDTTALNNVFLAEYNLMKTQPQYLEMKKFRDILPTTKTAEDLLKVINNNQVVVISGETGCGKSTQVPQIILDDAIKNKRGGNVKILVTQPRRIAASSLAMRVAQERAEKVGISVGYSVRLERKECRNRGSIMFCTTGVLLVEMELDQSLSRYSHIVLDEVHERDCQIDISMCMLKQVLKKRKDLKLILMSATLDAETLCAYYDDCPMLKIEGLAYPVQDVYLEQILEMTRFKLPPVVEQKFNKGHEQRPWMKHRSSGSNNAATAMEKAIRYRCEIGPWLESVKKSLDKDVYRTLQDRRVEDLNVDLIVELLICIASGEPGAILVFLPGISDITKLMKKMTDSRQFPASQYDIHPLHSKLPTLTQHRIFERPPAGMRKIIIATNIAETSITIDDIVYVVDCAKIKYNGLNVEDHISTLQVEWASKANLRQRRGRAGRCQPGMCYHLVTSWRASRLPERLLPELQRNDLLEPVLQIKRLRLGAARRALEMMPAAPDDKTIRNAVRHLQQCGALDEKETLTPLGWHMARLPLHPAAGKLLLLGALFGCLERAASVAAVWGFKDPFQLVIGKEAEVDKVKKIFALGEPSDHIAISEALMQWERSTDRSAFAWDHFLSSNTLKLLSEMKKQFGENLKQMGFLHTGDIRSTWENRNSDNLALFKAIIAASLYPNIGTVQWGNLSGKNPNKPLRINVRTPEEQRIQVHPSSVMSSKHQYGAKGPPLPICTTPGANWLVYWLKQRSSDLFLIDVTLVYTLPLLFFGELNVSQAETCYNCVIDIKSIKVTCAMDTTQMLYRLRSLLDQVLASKIMVSRGGKRNSQFEEKVLDAVTRLITAEDARTDYFGGNGDQSGSEDGSYDGRRPFQVPRRPKDAPGRWRGRKGRYFSDR